MNKRKKEEIIDKLDEVKEDIEDEPEDEDYPEDEGKQGEDKPKRGRIFGDPLVELG